MTKLTSTIILAVIVVLGSLFRIWQLGSVPNTALIDEAHFGYLAYSLLETGKDEHGISWPLLFKGFGDQKLPLYAYSLLPFVKLFGLSVTTIRLSSLLASIALIFGAYFLIKESFQSKLTALGAAMVTAFSPWPFFLSRFGFEANVSLCLYIYGLFFLIKFLKKPAKLYGFLSGLLLALPWYGYIAFRPTSVVILVAALGIGLYLKTITKRSLIWLVLPYIVLIIPWFLPQVSQSNSARFSQVGLVHDPGLTMEINEQRTFCSNKLPRVLCDAVFNKPILISTVLIERFMESFSSHYLVTSGEKNEVFLTVERFGQIAPLVYILFIAGIFVLVTNSRISPYVRFIGLVGLVTGLIPTILAGDPQKVRLTPWFPFVLLSVSAALYIAFNLKLNVWQKTLAGIVISALTIGHFGLFLAGFYFVHFQKHDFWYQSFAPQVSTYIQTTPSNTLVVIKPFYSDPLMFHAFYSKMNPTYYQQHARLGELEASGFQHTEQVGNIMAKSMEPEAIACEAYANGYTQAILLTNDKKGNLKSLHQIPSTNGVHVYVNAYLVPLSLCPGVPITAIEN